eukprot:gene2644-3112_t
MAGRGLGQASASRGRLRHAGGADPLSMRLFLGSDFHVDYRQNLDWLRALSRTAFTDDVLIVAGDLSDELDLVQ